MHPESEKYTSFVTPLGQFQFTRMPFGLKNAPSMFQRFIHKIFAEMIKEGEVIVYLDDIMIGTENLENHFQILEKVLNKITQNKLELRLDKCEFLQTSVNYLGYIVDGEGIRADDKGLEAIKNFPVPKNVHTVQSFIGLCSYFRRFVKDFSVLAEPLFDLTKKEKIFSFGAKELECFELLKSKLLGAPVLALYDPNDYTELHCDASSIGLGAILLQRKEDGKMHPIFYFSKRTTEAESRYHSFELEALAIVSALKRFRVYLQGKPFKIITDCNSLALTLNKKELNPRIARWALELQNFNYTLEHRAGKHMQHVDALSRSSNILVVETNTFEENLIICQGRDENLKKCKKLLEEKEHKLFEMRNGVLYRKKKLWQSFILCSTRYGG
uniref:RNA-directed DNA polymerase n=1 Tax=Bactrocera latifrons TaxID=174628 RepID=A0A0K8U9C0_BACLA